MHDFLQFQIIYNENFVLNTLLSLFFEVSENEKQHKDKSIQILEHEIDIIIEK